MKYTIQVQKTIGKIDLHYSRFAKNKKGLDALLRYELQLIESLERSNWIIFVNGKEKARGKDYKES